MVSFKQGCEEVCYLSPVFKELFECVSKWSFCINKLAAALSLPLSVLKHLYRLTSLKEKQEGPSNFIHLHFILGVCSS